ncbi:hypothetical protein [Mycobacterium sp.]|uniref:hypothetical protein n=1 Tax=Mycobacterium sp. TaxID=1785 RepID=UPI003F9DE06C
MRVAVLGAAGAALLGATLAIAPLDTPGAPVRGSGACGNGAGGSCERLASVLAPQAGPAGQATGPALAAPVPAPPAPAQAAGPSYALPAPHPVAAQVIAPGLAPRPGVPSAAVPGLGVPGVPGQTTVPGVGVPGVGVPGIPGLPGVGLPGTDISGYDLPGLLNQAYALVNGVVGADVAASTIGPITSGVLGAAGIVAGVGTSGLNLLVTLAYLNRLNGSGTSSNLAGAAKLFSLLAPTVGTAQLPAVSVQALAANLPALPVLSVLSAAALPAVALPALPSVPALVAGLKTLPPPQLPPLPPLPQLPPPPVLCGPAIGFFRPCI